MDESKTKPADAQAKRTDTRSRGTSGDTQSVKSEIPESERQPYKDIDGNVIDAPTIPSFERELQDAQNRADVNAIADVQERYHKARDEKVKRDNALERKRRKDNQ